MADYLLKSVVWQKDLNGLASSGLIGLSPSDHGEAQLFVPSLFKQGAIKKNMFSMFIDQNGQSKIQIGGYDLKKYASSDIKWYPIVSETYWAMRMDRNVKMGDFTLVAEVDKIMGDTGTSLNMIHSRDFQKIKNHFFSNSSCTVLPTTLTACECTEQEHSLIPDMIINLSGDDYVIPRNEWYVREPSLNMCVIKLMHGPRPQWIFGINFFQNYYSVMDYEKKQVGLAKSRNYLKGESKSFVYWAFGKKVPE